jgi:S1-C subfamily serine protease
LKLLARAEKTARLRRDFVLLFLQAASMYPRRCIVLAHFLTIAALWLPSTRSQAADQASLSDLIDKIDPSIVRIDVTAGAEKGVGSGYVVDADGLIATNYHVIAGAAEATAVFKNGENAKVLGTLFWDDKRDIAILKIDKSSLAALPLAAAPPRKGESVVAFGAPVGLSFSASEGIVSAVREGKELGDDEKDARPGTWIQTTAPISPGNSGGPLVNRDGQVVAMNTMQLVIGQNLNFAISSVDVAAALKAAQGKKLVALADGAAKAKPPRPPRSKNEMKPEEIPSTSIEAFINAGQKSFSTGLGDARKRLAEANEKLAAIKKASTRNTLAAEAKAQGADYATTIIQGRTVYLFADTATKDKVAGEQESVVAKVSDMVKKLADPKEGMLNYLKSAGPKLTPNAVGDVGCVSDLTVLLISDEDEFRSVVERAPVTVRGIGTSSLATGSKLDGRVMYVAGTETVAMNRGSGDRIKVFVLREVPDEMLAQRLSPSGSTAGKNSSATTAKADAKSTVDAVAEKTAARGNSSGLSPVKTTDAIKADEFRTWVDKTGRYKKEAQFVGREDDKVVLKGRDGAVLRIPAASLSEQDQEFLKNLLATAK